MTIQCKIHNRGPGAEVFSDADGAQVTVEGGQTVDVTLSEAGFKGLKRFFDNKDYRLDLVEAQPGDDSEKPKDSKESAGDLINSTKTADDLKREEEERRKNESLGTQHPSETSGEGEDSIDKLLADAESQTLTYSQLRSRAKTLLGNDFPVGTSPKKDEIVELLQEAKRKRSQP